MDGWERPKGDHNQSYYYFDTGEWRYNYPLLKMCINLEKLKAHSVHIVWLAAMFVFSFLFWFTITPLLFSRSGAKGKKPSLTYIPEFGLIALFFWITFLMAFWCCFQKLLRDDDPSETTHIMQDNEDFALKVGLNDSVRKRLGLLNQDDLVGSPKSGNNDEKVAEVQNGGNNLQEVNVEAQDKCGDGDKPKKRGLISRLSSMRRSKSESDEPDMKIISLPDFSKENSFRLLMPHSGDECEHCYLWDRNSIPFTAPAIFCKECGQICYSSRSHSGNWNSGKPKNLNTDLRNGSSMGEDPALSTEPNTPEEAIIEMPETEERYNENHGDLGKALTEPEAENSKKEDPLTKNERKSLKKTESLFLLQALHNQQSSKSEIFVVVDDFGCLVDEPMELAELHGFKQ